MGPESQVAASKSFNVLRDSGASGPVADTGRPASLDNCDCVSDKALSRYCLEMDIGLASATGADRAVLRDI